MRGIKVLIVCLALAACRQPATETTETADLTVGLLVLEGTPDTDSDDKFEIKLAKRERTWTESEPGGASRIFSTKSGPFVIVPTNIITLQKPGGTIVGQLRGITINSPVGASGRGLSSEKAVNFGWTVKSSN
jgi:hypothetical protein